MRQENNERLCQRRATTTRRLVSLKIGVNYQHTTRNTSQEKQVSLYITNAINDIMFANKNIVFYLKCGSNAAMSFAAKSKPKNVKDARTHNIAEWTFSSITLSP